MRKLQIELVPDGCWYYNLRTALPRKVWDMIRFDAKKRSGERCSICGRKATRLEAHEQWSYDEKKGVQKLEDVIAVCHDCHSAIHMERTSLLGDIERAENHYIRVNGCTYAEMKKDRSEANETHKRRSRIEWVTDTSWLKRFTEKNGHDN